MSFKQDLDESVKITAPILNFLAHPFVLTMFLSYIYVQVVVPKGLAYELAFFGFLFYNLVRSWMQKH